MFLGARSIIISIFLLWLFSSLNSALFPEATSYTYVRFVVIFVALIMSFHQLPIKILEKNMKVFFWIFILTLFILIQSFFKNQFVDVSILKIINWSALTILLMNCWMKIDKKEFYRLSKNIFYFFTLIIISSLFLIKSKFGYVLNIDLFQGILIHPQIFAIVLAIFGVMLFAGFPYKFNSIILNLSLGALVFYMLILTNSRTGILGFSLAIFISLLINPTFDNIKKKYTNTAKIFYLLSLIVLPFFIIIIFELNNFANIDFLQNIITKSGNTEETFLIDAYLDSRGYIFEKSYDNIKVNFFSGIGFGIGSDLETFRVSRDPFFGIPYGAAIEKGNILIAILEELGIFGLSIFILFLLRCFLNLCDSSFKALPMFSVIFLLNLGEYSFFSTGGVGSLIMIFFTLSISKKNFARTMVDRYF